MMGPGMGRWEGTGVVAGVSCAPEINGNILWKGSQTNQLKTGRGHLNPEVKILNIHIHHKICTTNTTYMQEGHRTTPEVRNGEH